MNQTCCSVCVSPSWQRDFWAKHVASNSTSWCFVSKLCQVKACLHPGSVVQFSFPVSQHDTVKTKHREVLLLAVCKGLYSVKQRRWINAGAPSCRIFFYDFYSSLAVFWILQVANNNQGLDAINELYLDAIKLEGITEQMRHRFRLIQD